MSTFLFERIETPTEEQIDASAELFYELMQDNLGVVSLSGVLAGEYYAATKKEGEIVGFTLWMPPGQDMFSTDEQRNLGLNDFMARLSEEGKEYYRTTYLAHFPGFVSGVLGPRGKLDSWWMHMCMVRPEHHRKGIAKALINLVLEKAAKSGETLACSTTSDENVLVYLAMGFTHRGKKIMPSPWGEWPVHLFSLDTSK